MGNSYFLLPSKSNRRRVRTIKCKTNCLQTTLRIPLSVEQINKLYSRQYTTEDWLVKGQRESTDEEYSINLSRICIRKSLNGVVPSSDHQRTTEWRIFTQKSDCYFLAYSIHPKCDHSCGCLIRKFKNLMILLMACRPFSSLNYGPQRILPLNCFPWAAQPKYFGIPSSQKRVLFERCSRD